MRLEIIIDRKHQIPTATMEALRQELLKQLGERFPDLHVRVAPGSAMALTVSRASKEDREPVYYTQLTLPTNYPV